MKVSEKSMTTLYNIKYKKYIHLQLQCKNTKIDVSQTHDSHFSESYFFMFMNYFPNLIPKFQKNTRRKLL